MSQDGLSQTVPIRSSAAKPESSKHDSNAPNVLPGFGLPVDHMPGKYVRSRNTPYTRFPHAIADNVASDGVTVRERRMLQFIDQISDKPEWERKVFDEEIVGKWRAEAGREDEEIGDVVLSEEMFEYVSFVV